MKKTISLLLSLIMLVASLPTLAQESNFNSDLKKLVEAATHDFKGFTGKMITQKVGSHFPYESKAGLAGMDNAYLYYESGYVFTATTLVTSSLDGARAEYNSYVEKINNCLGTNAKPLTTEEDLSECKFEKDKVTIRLLLVKTDGEKYFTSIRIWEPRNAYSGEELCPAIKKILSAAPTQFSAIKGKSTLKSGDISMYDCNVQINGMQLPSLYFSKAKAQYSTNEKMQFQGEADMEYTERVLELSDCLGLQGERVSANGNTKKQTVFHQDGSDIDVTLSYDAADLEYTVAIRVIRKN